MMRLRAALAELEALATEAGRQAERGEWAAVIDKAQRAAEACRTVTAEAVACRARDPHEARDGWPKNY